MHVRCCFGNSDTDAVLYNRLQLRQLQALDGGHELCVRG